MKMKIKDTVEEVKKENEDVKVLTLSYCSNLLSHSITHSLSLPVFTIQFLQSFKGSLRWNSQTEVKFCTSHCKMSMLFIHVTISL